MKWRWIRTVTFILMICAALGSSAWAFQDVERHPDKDKILSMKERGLISGINDQTFNPNAPMTYAQGIQLIVKGLGLNIDHLKFIKEPKASDYYKYVPDEAWYSQAFIIAQFTLEPEGDIKPNEPMTREEFAHYLFKGMMTKGQFAFIEIYIGINDEKEINPAYMDAIQKLLIIKVAELDEKGNFKPKAPVTRAEAAVMTYKAIEAIEKLLAEPTAPVDPDVALNVEKVNDEVNKVTVTWGEKPNSGYRIKIDRIEFNDDGKAAVIYSLLYPQPDQEYAQVVTTPKAVVYVATDYELSLIPNPDQPMSGGDGAEGQPGQAGYAKSAEPAVE